MMMETISLDLESALTSLQPNSRNHKALGTKVLSPQEQLFKSVQKSYGRQESFKNDEVLFAGENGTALLLAFSSGKSREGNALLIPVYRPSKNWARRMANLEKESDELPVAIPDVSSFEVERWKEFRWKYPGESESDIWRRIRRQFEAQMPSWYSWVPFWRPVLLQERIILVHHNESCKFTVEVVEPVNFKDVQEKANEDFSRAKAECAKYNPGEYFCHGEFDAFGEWYSTFHDTPCRKDIAIDDYNVDCCLVELFCKSKWQRDKIGRYFDFLRCYTEPWKADTVFPLTCGRIMDSCIYDQEFLWNLKLPQRGDPTRLPVPVNGIFIEYQLDMTKAELEVGGVLSFVFMVVLGWKLATGDWNVAASFGSLIVALVAFTYTRCAERSSGTVEKAKVD